MVLEATSKNSRKIQIGITALNEVPKTGSVNLAELYEEYKKIASSGAKR